MLSLIFFGSDQYSVAALSSLLDNCKTGILQNVVIVTDRKTPPNPVETFAITHNIKVAYYPNIPSELIIKDTYGVIASFGHILPADLIAKFPHGILNIHPSLLPQYRGVAPVPYAIALGDETTGISVFKIDAGVDTGAIVAQVEVPIPRAATAPELLMQFFAKGADLVVSYLIHKELPTTKLRNWDTGKLIYARRFTRDSGYIEWPVVQKLLAGNPVTPDETKNELLRLRLQKELQRSSHLESSSYLLDLARALNPWPGVWTICPTKKGDLHLSLVSHSGSVIPDILISGKPNPITLADFTKYYL